MEIGEPADEGRPDDALSIEPHDGYFVILHAGTTEPAVDIRYRITAAFGRVVEGRSDAAGRTVIVPTRGPEVLRLEILADDLEEVPLAALDGP